MPVTGFSFPLPQAYSWLINHRLFLKWEHFCSWGPSSWAQALAGGDPRHLGVRAELRGLSLQELWRGSVAWPPQGSLLGQRGSYKSVSLPWGILELYFPTSLQSPHLLCWQAAAAILPSWKEAESRFPARQVEAGFLSTRYLLWIKRNVCMEQVQKPRAWCHLQKLLSGRSRTLSLMFSLLLCLAATELSVFEMLSLLCHPRVSQALLFSCRRTIATMNCCFCFLLLQSFSRSDKPVAQQPHKPGGPWSRAKRGWHCAGLEGFSTAASTSFDIAGVSWAPATLLCQVCNQIVIVYEFCSFMWDRQWE